MAKSKGTWVRVTYDMPAVALRPRRATRIPNGSEVRVESYDRATRKYEVTWKGHRYVVTVKELEANGPRDLHDMFKFLNR